MLGTHQTLTTVLLNLHRTDMVIVQWRKLIMLSLIMELAVFKHLAKLNSSLYKFTKIQVMIA